jgi:hypothetical protein
MVALTDAQEAAVLSFMSSKRGTRKLIDSTITKMTAHFKAEGMTLQELPTATPPTVQEKEVWVDEWKEYAVDAGVTHTANINNVGRWIESDEHTGVGARSGKASAVADALARKGITLDRDAELAVHSALVHVEKGELEAQCRDVDVIWIIYTGQSPGEEDRLWFENQRNSMRLSKDGEDPRVDIRKCKGYFKQLASTTIVTLERALLKDRTGVLWNRYYQSTITELQQKGYDKAATRWIEVCAFAKQQTETVREMAYLAIYFLDLHIGQGMPLAVCTLSALQMQGTTASIEAKQQQLLQLTVPEENALYQQANPWGQQALVHTQQLQLQQLQHQVQQWHLWAGQQGSGSSQGTSYNNHQQQYNFQGPAAGYPGGAGGAAGGGPIRPHPAIEEETPPAQEGPCAFCGSTRHGTDKCTDMHKYRASFRKDKKEGAKALDDAKKAAAAAMAAAAAGAGAGAGASP